MTGVTLAINDKAARCIFWRACPTVVFVVTLFLAIAPQATARDQADPQASPPVLRPHIADCGVASVYCALTELGVPVAKEDLTAQFSRVHGNDDLSSLTMEELIQVLRQYEVNATAVKFDPPNVDKVPTPAILYVAQQFRSRVLGTGHFAVLTDVNDEFGTIVDLTLVGEGRQDGIVEVHKGRLRSVWQGEAILLGSNSIASSRLISNRNLGFSAAILLTLTIYVGMGTCRLVTKSAVHD